MNALKFALANKDATVALTREITNAKADDPRPGFVFDDAAKFKAVDPTLPLPGEKIMWIQEQMVKAGSMTKALDLSAVTAPEYRERALKKVGMQ
jgi:NitT/TauT family transport system substrate-binding protein